MSIRLEVGGTYASQGGHRVRVLGSVSNGHIGKHIKQKLNDGSTERVFVPTSFFRCRFTDTGEVIFYNQWGTIISEHPSDRDKPYNLIKRVS